MSRLARIHTIWRKELIDTLRDRRTLAAMVLAPMVLYPIMIIGSLQGLELQVIRLKQEVYRVGVTDESIRQWLRQIIDTDPVRRPGAAGLPAEELVERDVRGELPAESRPAAPPDRSPAESARSGVREHPPEYEIEVVPDARRLAEEVLAGRLHAGLLIAGPLPSAGNAATAALTLLTDPTEIRSQMAVAGLEGILERAGRDLVRQRLARLALPPGLVQPLELRQETVATPEKVGGSILGQIVPLFLIIMTITGAIYPAIDLTAGERERGTLETLMAAPVPTVDLIAGKFVVVALIGMLSATLNLLSIGGTVYLGGLGALLGAGDQVVIPLHALPWVLLVLIPLAIMFAAVLLAVCSFARSFKEAQNYVMPVLVAALLPAVIGVLPGMRLEGPLRIMPVTNIVLLTRDLFTGRFELVNFLWVLLSSTLYAGAAVAVAAKLFGQEAVLFADSGSIRTLFQRRFFKPSDRPAAAQAFLLLAVAFSANFFAQSRLLAVPDILGTPTYWLGLTGILLAVFVALPAAAGLYTRVRLGSAFNLRRPPARGVAAALCFGASTWILAQAWMSYQKTWLPMPAEVEAEFTRLLAGLGDVHPAVLLLMLAVLPAVCEELFFRGYALSGLCGGLGRVAAVLVVSFAFALNHHSVHRLIVTGALGVVFGLLVVRHGSLWPAILAHLLHNGLSVLAARGGALHEPLARVGYVLDAKGYPPAPWTLAAAGLALAGLLLCRRASARPIASPALDRPAAPH